MTLGRIQVACGIGVSVAYIVFLGYLVSRSSPGIWSRHLEQARYQWRLGRRLQRWEHLPSYVQEGLEVRGLAPRAA